MKGFDKFVAYAVPVPEKESQKGGFAELACDSTRFPILADMLETAVRNLPSGDPHATQWTRWGFSAPNPHEAPVVIVDEVLGEQKDTPYVIMDENEKYIWLVFEERARMLSSATIKDALAEVEEEYYERHEEPMTKRERNEARDKIVADLLPKAPIKRTRTNVMIIEGVIIVFAGSKNVGDKVTSSLRKALGSLPVIDWFEAPDFVNMFLKKIAKRDYDTDTPVGKARADFELVGNAKLKLESGDYTFKGVEDITEDESFTKALSMSDGMHPYGLIEGHLHLTAPGSHGRPLAFTLSNKGAVKGVKWVGEDEASEFDPSEYDEAEERESAMLRFNAWDGYTAALMILTSLYRSAANRFEEDAGDWNVTNFEEDDI